MMTWGCSLSLFGRDGWTDHPTSSDMGSRSVQRCVDIGWSIMTAEHREHMELLC